MFPGLPGIPNLLPNLMTPPQNLFGNLGLPFSGLNLFAPLGGATPATTPQIGWPGNTGGMGGSTGEQPPPNIILPPPDTGIAKGGGLEPDETGKVLI